MHKIFTILLTLGLLFATSVIAGEPPAPPGGAYQGGWGMCPVDWENQYGSFEAEGIWRPGHDWVVGYTGGYNENPIYIQYEPICLDLWIELYCMQTYQFTNYEWHRIGDRYEDVTFFICGTVSSNNPEWVGLTRASQDLDRLHFIGDIFGSDNNEADIPITWHYAWGDWDPEDDPPLPENIANWQSISPGNNGNMYFYIPESCDHWFCWKGEFRILYHQADGHYQLHMAGCPAPGL